MLEVYTDGSCSGNGKLGAVGGGAFAVVRNGEVLYTESFGASNTTNQRMELEAAIRACDYCCVAALLEQIIIYSDSAYLINCYEQRWYNNWESNNWVNSKKQPVSNQDQWIRLIPYFKDFAYTFRKVKGHNGVEFNELVDKLAVDATNRMKGERDGNSRS